MYDLSNLSQSKHKVYGKTLPVLFLSTRYTTMVMVNRLTDFPGSQMKCVENPPQLKQLTLSLPYLLQVVDSYMLWKGKPKRERH